jgi:regulator of protease activity HflC (stomatin/prohibitin superfamily)
MDSTSGFTIYSLVYIAFLILVLVTLKKAIQIVPQSENWLIERLGKYNRKLEAGLHITIPFFEQVRYRVQIQERQLPPKPINAITQDNVTIVISLAVLYRITDAPKTMYRIADVDSAILTIVNGTVRSVLGKTDLDGVQSNRRELAQEIEIELQEVSDEWGIKLTRVEITEVDVDDETKSAMQQQLNSERKRRSAVTEAEGRKQATQLDADAKLYAADKEAQAKKILADAEAYAVHAVSKSITDGGASAIEFEIKKIHANAIQELSKSSNAKLILLPSDVLSSLSGVIGRINSKL